MIGTVQRPEVDGLYSLTDQLYSVMSVECHSLSYGIQLSAVALYSYVFLYVRYFLLCFVYFDSTV